MFDPLWLRSFVAVVETLGFTAAGQRVGLRQSTVSGHVRKLEECCGRRLFVRDTHSVRLNSDGEAMFGFATSILEVNARAMRHFGDKDMRGRIRLGVSEDVVLSGFPDVLRRFTSSHPCVEIELTVGLSESLRACVDDGDLDLVFLKRRIGDSNGTCLWREPMVWISAGGFHIERDMPVPLVVLAPPALTRSAALEVLEADGRQWRIVCSSGSQSGVHAAVAAGLGVAPHARSQMPPNFVELSETALPPLGDIEFALIFGRNVQKGAVRVLGNVIAMSGDLLRGRRITSAAGA